MEVDAMSAVPLSRSIEESPHIRLERVDGPPVLSELLLAVLVEKRAVLLSTAAMITGSWSRAEDVMQDAYLRLVNVSKGALPSKAHVVSYVFQVIRNLAIDCYRKQELEQRYLCTEEEGLDVDTGGDTPDNIHCSLETLDIIDKALSELPRRTRYAFEMYRLQGVQQKQIAQELGVSTTLVNFMIRDALIHCKKAVEASRGIDLR